MASYKLMIKDVIKKADVLLEVVDARFPDETRNSEVERNVERSRKPLIIVLSKCDLVSKETLEKSKSRLSKIAPTVFVSSKERFGTTMLRHKILEVADIKGRDILVGSLGYPNTGKSSVINGVAGKNKASTSSISGHTKGVQLVKAGSRIVFIDTPGVIPFDENDEYRQGLLGVKDATHLSDPIGVSMKIIETICAENKPVLEEFYKVEIGNENSYEILELIGLKANFLKKKGEVDETRVAIKIINDWQKGKLLI
ncbi:Ras superfamily GTP-binding protein YlqF [Methanococcoides vulcani]|uniref:Ras superfamily GTP-binding protein YlqF n=1 Tax=Methanococcoides vulcani TaxID=1353158 RepID=A0A1I0B445_9EURY|nr:GTPase [Methanococcoides vulcani]SET01540.1 Ras superfamily GTP-binding protein YlqF [Methanococcoides vulcani]